MPLFKPGVVHSVSYVLFVGLVWEVRVLQASLHEGCLPDLKEWDKSIIFSLHSLLLYRQTQQVTV